MSQKEFRTMDFIFEAKPNGLKVSRDLNAFTVETLGFFTWAVMDKLAEMRPPKPGTENAG